MTKSANITPRPLTRAQKFGLRCDAEIATIAARVGSPALREAIQAIADHAPEYRAAAHRHTDAERGEQEARQREGATAAEIAAAEKAEERADRVWMRTLSRRNRLAAQMLDAPVAGVPDILAKADAYARACESRDISKVAFSEDQELVLAAVLRDLRGLAPPPEDRASWDAARAAFEAAWDAEREASRVYSELDKDMDARVPVPAALAGTPEMSEAPGFRAVELAKRPDGAQLVRLYREWEAEATAARAPDEARLRELNLAWEEADDAVWAAYGRMMTTPAPDAAARAFKWEMYATLCKEDTRGNATPRTGFRDPALVAAMADGYGEDRGVVELFRDAMRAAGQHGHPALAVDFKPRGWVDQYEAAGGLVLTPLRYLLLVPPADRGKVADLEAALAAAPWKARAVLEIAWKRTTGGGCRFFDTFGELKHGREEPRGWRISQRELQYDRIEDADEAVTSRDPEGVA